MSTLPAGHSSAAKRDGSGVGGVASLLRGRDRRGGARGPRLQGGLQGKSQEGIIDVRFRCDHLSTIVIRRHSLVHLHILHLGLRRGLAEGQRVPLDPGV